MKRQLSLEGMFAPASASPVAPCSSCSDRSVTFVSSERGRANEIGGAYEITRTETVHESGLIEWHVRGTEDGEWIDRRGTRQAEKSMRRPLDLERITEARRRAGWTVRPTP